MGDGLISFLVQLREIEEGAGTATAGSERARLIMRTPSVQHLSRVFRLFPDARVLVLVRDPRSVVESGRAGFGWTPETAMQLWAEGARTILAATAAPAWREEH